MKPFSIPDNWKWDSASNYVDIIGGVSYSPEDITDEGIRIIRGGNIQNGFIVMCDDDIFLPKSYKDDDNSIKKGDIILVASTGSTEALGRVAISQEDLPGVQIGAFLRILRPKSQKYASFIAPWFASEHFTNYIRKVAKGTSINNIGRSHINDFKIPVPQNIAPIVDTFDAINSKIALNRRMNVTLEKMAKQLYDYWFVQFDFPNEEDKPYKSSGGKMIYNKSLKREIPEGWEVKELKHLTTYSEDNNSSSTLGNYISTDNMLRNKAGVTFNLSVPTYSSSTVYSKGDILISNIRPYFKKIWFADRDGLCSNDVLCIRANNKLYSHLVYMSLWQDVFFEYVMKGSKGTKMPRGDKNHIMDYLIWTPDNNNLLIRFNSIMNTIQDKRSLIMKENNKLFSLRDYLLPLLMKGQAIIME